MNLDQLPDEQLLEAYIGSNDPEIIGYLFDRYTHLVYGVCLKYLQHQELAKDAVMEIFENILLNIHKHKVEFFKSWLYQVAKNFCLMKLRKKEPVMKVLDQSDEKNASFFMESEVDLHHTIEEEEGKVIKLKKAMEQLNEGQRTCVELMYLQNKTYKEISEITGLGLNEVKSFIQNGKRNLKLLMEKA